MVATDYLIRAAALLSVALAAGVKPTIYVHAVGVDDGLLESVEDTWNTITGPPKAKSVVYVTKTAYYDGPEEDDEGSMKKRDNTKYTDADKQLAAQIKPYLERGFSAAQPVVGRFLDNNGNFNSDKAAALGARALQVCDTFLRTNIIRKRSLNYESGSEKGYTVDKLRARNFDHEDVTVAKRSNLPSQADLKRGLAPICQLSYDTYSTVTYLGYDEAALDVAHKIHGVLDGSIRPNVQFVESDQSRQLASDITPIFVYTKGNCDKVIAAYTDSNGNFDDDKATNDLVKAISFAQKFTGGLGFAKRSLGDMEYKLVELGTNVLNEVAAKEGLQARDYSQQQMYDALRPYVAQSYQTYVMIEKRFSDDQGNFSNDKATRLIGIVMAEYSKELSAARANKGN